MKNGYLILVLFLVSCNHNHLSSPNGMRSVLMKINEVQKAIYVDETEVTNDQFQEFIKATGYVTTAEKPFRINYQKENKVIDSLVAPGSLVFKPTDGPVPLHDFNQWWIWVPGAYWAAPLGASSNINNIMDHPVVHVSFLDAMAYAKWAKKRLPTEQEWEYLASGSENNVYAWGNTQADYAASKGNFWQGFFPFENNLDDGFEATAPVKSFEPNAFGLYEMSGNVWEWCTSTTGQPLVKGGSFLCNDSYCSGYRIDSRMPNDQESSLNHTGFRLVKDVE